MWGNRYKANPGYVLGFHGCDEEVGERVLANKRHLFESDNDHDWLGPGIYFWESSPARALQWAKDAVKDARLTRGSVKKPFVVGAVIDLGHCCNLFDAEALKELKEAHRVLKLVADQLPTNRGRDQDKALRFLDCAVIQVMHAIREQNGLKPYDAVRAAFPEGKPLYKGAGLSSKNHIQLAVKKHCIKGYFRPIRTSMK